MIIRCLNEIQAERLKCLLRSEFPNAVFNSIIKRVDGMVLLIINGNIDLITQDFAAKHDLDIIFSSLEKDLFFVNDATNPQLMKIGNRSYHKNDRLVSVIAGPCAIESYDALLDTAKALKEAGVSVFRAMPEKPRTSPYNFQGVGAAGFEYLARIKQDTGLPVLAEVFCKDDIDIACSLGIDMIQIGSRNMQNYNLLKVAASSGIDCILKKGMWCTNEQLLKAAEYFHVYGEGKVALCERGIQTHESSTRNTFDMSSVSYLKSVTNHPVVADPSHGTGRRDMVIPISTAAVLMGADAIEVEVHVDPDSTIRPGDGYQMLDIIMYRSLLEDARRVMAISSRRFDWEAME